MLNTTLEKHRGIFIGILLVAGILGPPLTIHSGLPDVRLDEIVLFLLVIGTFLKFPFQELNGKKLRLTTKIFIAFGLSVLLSTLYANFFLKYEFSPRDLTEYITFGLYWVGFVFAANWQEINIDSIKLLAKIGLAAAYIIAVFGFCQLYNIGNINAWLTPVYTAPVQMAGLTGGFHRTVGTFGNPNVWGFFMMMVLTFQVAWLYWQDLDWRSWKPYGQLVLIYFGLMALFMSLSRSAVLVMAVILVYLSLSKWKRDKLSRKAVFITFVMLVITLVALFTAPQSFLFRMAEGARFTKSTSIAGRIEQWGTAWELIRVSPIFGWGTAKGFLTTIVDNDYVLIVRRYGLIGLSVFLTFWVHFAWRAVLLARKERGPVIHTLAQASLAITIGVLIFDFSSGILYNLQVMPVYLMIQGICLSWLAFKEDEA